MAVNLHNASRYVRQAVETWTSVAKHDLGFTFTDRTSAKDFRYVKYYPGSVATTIGMQSGVAVGPYIASANVVHAENTVTDDASLGLRPTGVIRSSTTSSANIYGFMEVIQQNLPTTVLTSMDNSVAQGDGLVWADRWFTTVALNTLAFGVTAFGQTIDSHLASSDQAGSTLTTATLGTPVMAIFFG